MKRKVTLALAFLALSGALGSTAYARDGGRNGGGRAGMMPPLETLDADKNGDITLEEFTKASNERFTSGDADKDGKLTVAEIAAEIERMRAEQMARRTISRFDSDGDGMLSAEESASGQKKIFAMLDKNDDGKIVKDEFPRKGGRNGKGGDGAK